MKKVLMLSVIMLIGIVTLDSCKKYDEGPGLSLRSKKARLAGDWDVKKFTVDDVDALSYNNEAAGFTYSSIITMGLKFEKEGTWTSNTEVVSSISGPGAPTTSETTTASTNGTWEFTSSKEKLSIKEEGEDAEEWTIMRLANKELILEFTNSDNEKLRMELEQ